MIFFEVQKTEVIAPQFDACASWWTQGPDAIMQVILITFLAINSINQTSNNQMAALGTAWHILAYPILPVAQTGDRGCHGHPQFYLFILYIKVFLCPPLRRTIFLLVTLLKQFCLRQCSSFLLLLNIYAYGKVFYQSF